MLISTNKRVVGLVGQFSLFESSDSNVWSVCFRRNPSDSAAHAEHLALLSSIKDYELVLYAS